MLKRTLIALLAVLPSAVAQDAARPAWPKEFDARGSKIVVYEPQVESLRKQFLTTRAAISVTREDAAEPVFGAVWLEAALSPDSDRGPAAPLFVRASEIRLPNLPQAEAALLRQEIEDEIPGWKLSYSTLVVVAELKIAEQQKAAAEEIKADVPRILFRTNPAVLLSIDGEPVWRKSADPDLERLENTAAFVVRDSRLGLCTLHIPPFWWTSTDLLGPWQPVDDVPEGVETLWKNEPRPQLPPSADGQQASTPPEVIAATTPTELVWTDGEARYVPITGTDLLYIQNTESDVFLEIQSQTLYALFSGRWYRMLQTKEDWEFVPSDRLPSDFSRIPLSSEKRHVLACVAGTPQARAALRDAEIPQTETVKPGPAPELEASYDGEPQFTGVADIGVSYAVNTPYSIFCTGGRYYWCFDGIWYDAADAWGPWFVCVGVPRAIYLLPPSCPHYYVTYCHVFGVSSNAVCVGYYPGYRGCYPWRGSVVYGTGWHYRPWVGTHFYTRPATWGVGAHYTSRSSGWSVRLGSGGTSVWGLRHAPGGRGSQVQAGAGGSWGGAPTHPAAGHRAPPAAPVNLDPGQNLYARHPHRLAPNPARPSDRPPTAAPRRDAPPELPGTRQGPGRTPLPPREHREGPQAPPPSPGREIPRTPPREPRENPSTPPQRENPRTPAPPAEHRENPNTSPPPREYPRTPVPPSEHGDNPNTPPTPREHPRTPAPPPEHRAPPRTPPASERETPRTPPPPPSADRENPRTPPPPREIPRTPPSTDREAPRTPPPREQRENPRTPPPPSDREAPRTPPPQREREPREIPKTPPPPQNREVPHAPPPPPPQHREVPHTPPPAPPPPPPREHREAPRNPPPSEHRQQKDPPGSSDRRR